MQSRPHKLENLITGLVLIPGKGHNEHYYFEIKVGLKTLELEKGKAAIDVGKKEDLPTVISTIIKAVESGELDAQILQLSPAKPPKQPKAKTTDKK